MNVDLELEDLINLVTGVNPPVDDINKLEREGLGNFNGSYGTWSWNKHSLKGLTEVRLYELYLKIR